MQMMRGSSRGQGIGEYALLLTLIFVVLYFSFLMFKPIVAAAFARVNVQISVAELGYTNVDAGPNNPVMAKEICKVGQGYYVVYAKTAEGKDVVLGVCALGNDMKIRSVTEVKK